jgi:hypothetical protein
MPNVLTREQMRETYGPFFERSANVSLDRTRVPADVWPLLPYAEFWGATDDWTREALVTDSPVGVAENLKAVVQAFDDMLDSWLAGPEADNRAPSREFLAFAAMVMAADFV